MYNYLGLHPNVQLNINATIPSYVKSIVRVKETNHFLAPNSYNISSLLRYMDTYFPVLRKKDSKNNR